MKMPLKDPSKKATSRKASEPNRCAFETSDGRRCRLPRSSTHASLCAFHSHEEQQLLESRKLGSEIAAPLTGNFLTATDINHVLGKVFTAVAQNRLPVRTAHTLAYLAQLMLMSVPAIKKEFDFYYKFEQWNTMLNRAVRLSPPPPPDTACLSAPPTKRNPSRTSYPPSRKPKLLPLLAIQQNPDLSIVSSPHFYNLSFRAAQADFLFRVRSCERVGLRSRGISLVFLNSH